MQVLRWVSIEHQILEQVDAVRKQHVEDDDKSTVVRLLVGTYERLAVVSRRILSVVERRLGGVDYPFACCNDQFIGNTGDLSLRLAWVSFRTCFASSIFSRQFGSISGG